MLLQSQIIILYVLVMSRTHFRVNPHPIVASLAKWLSVRLRLGSRISFKLSGNCGFVPTYINIQNIHFLCNENKSINFLSFILPLHKKILFSFLTSSTQCIASQLREKCPNTELFLVCIFLYSDWIHVNLRIQSKYRKIRTRNKSVLGYFSRSAAV